MKSIVSLIPIAILLGAATDAYARKWPTPDGGTVEADLILIRNSSVVVREKVDGLILIELKYDQLREIDRRYLARQHHFRAPTQSRLHSRRDYQILTACPTSLSGNDSNPAMFARAINYLQQLGTSKAIRLLEEYIASGQPGANDRALLIVPLTFRFAKHDLGSPIAGHVFFTLSSDLPFNDLCGDYSILAPGSAKPFVRWAERHGRLRQDLLMPGDPLAAAEAVINRTDDEQCIEHIRRQAWDCIAELFPLEWRCTFAAPLNDARWSELKDVSALLKVVWCNKQQQFVAGNPKAHIPSPPEAIFPKRVYVE